MTCPTIQTGRLTLRPLRMGDWEALGAFLRSDGARYMGGPYDEWHAWAAFAADAGLWALQGFGYWAMEDRATGALVGEVGLAQPPFFAEPELGWLTLPPFQRRGFAREGAEAARAWAYRTRGWPTLVSYVERENAASAALARSLGCTEDAGAARPDPTDLVFRHPAAPGPGAPGPVAAEVAR